MNTPAFMRLRHYAPYRMANRRDRRWWQWNWGRFACAGVGSTLPWGPYRWGPTGMLRAYIDCVQLERQILREETRLAHSE